MKKLFNVFKKIDDVVYSLEKIIITISLIVMSVIVFFDVVWRVYHSPGTQLGKFILWISGFFIDNISKDTTILIHLYVAGPIYYLLAYMLIYFGLKTSLKKQFKKVTLAGISFLVLVGLRLILAGIIIYFNNGFPWSQTLALCLMLWTGFLGASMTTKDKRHISIDAFSKLIPQKYKFITDSLAYFCCTLFCGFLCLLGIMYVQENYIDWVESGGRVSTFPILALPYWPVTASIPISLFIMSLRFLGYGISMLYHKIPKAQESEIAH